MTMLYPQENGLSESECNAHWLDKHVAEQSGMSALVSAAAQAIEIFGEDELEEHAAKLRNASSAAYQF